MDPLLKCLLDLCWHVAFLFYQVSTWNWTLLLVIYNVDTLCRDKQEGILRNELNAFLFFSEKPNFWPTQGNVLKISYRGKPCPGSHIFDDIHQNTGKSSARIQVRDPCYQPPQECRLHSLKSPAQSISRSSKSRQSKLVVYLKIVYISVSIKWLSVFRCRYKIIMF